MTKLSGFDGMPPFAMVTLDPSGGPALAALRDGLIQTEDMLVVVALMAKVNWRSGRAWVEAETLAPMLGLHGDYGVEQVRASLARLRAAQLVGRGKAKDGGRKPYWCLHPTLCLTGGKHKRLLQFNQFAEALEAAVPSPGAAA